MSNYYQEQLKKINPHATEYPEKIKIFANGNGQDTNFLDLNEESVKVLIEWLTKNYITK